MSKKNMNPAVDFYFDKATQWQDEMKQLRTILLDCNLDEELKWSKPCYAYKGNNIVVIQGFKAYCAVLFFKGFLLSDPDGVLIKTGENTRVGRQIRFNNVKEVVELAYILKAYIMEAIAIEKSGVKVEAKEKTELIFPEEFQQILKENLDFKNAFNALTLGRQRAYNIYFSQPKQSKTRIARIEKYIPRILDGKGLMDY